MGTDIFLDTLFVQKSEANFWPKCAHSIRILIGAHSIWAAQCIKVDMVQWNFLEAWLLFFWWNWIPAYIWMEIEKSMQFFSSWMFGLLNNDIEWRPVFKTFLMWYWAKERTKGREECLKLQFWSFKISQMSCWVLLFLRCHHQIFVCTQDCRVWRNFKWLWWTSLLSFDAATLLMRASDALKTNIFLSTIGNVRERGEIKHNYYYLGTLFTTFMNLCNIYNIEFFFIKSNYYLN